MSVSLHLEKDGQLNEYVAPVATEEIFINLWLPSAKALNLEWVPCFQSGITLSPDEIPSVVDELLRLRNYIAFHLEPSAADQLVKRIENIMVELSQIKDERRGRVFIG